ncbi:MAG: Type 1 glutamine amidotransferase-like domain-containing protein [Ferruginibacter sp.]|nr:Type 1 glutamine amidotransferase-like domain-containing protein [Ferruginibacter sp.]
MHYNNIDIAEGLSLLTNAVIDQHFIVRSRYNRLLSAIAKYPGCACIGIDETTAIIVQGNKVTITCDSQVVLMQKPLGLKIIAAGLIKTKHVQFSIFTNEDVFFINQGK